MQLMSAKSGSNGEEGHGKRYLGHTLPGLAVRETTEAKSTWRRDPRAATNLKS